MRRTTVTVFLLVSLCPAAVNAAEAVTAPGRAAHALLVNGGQQPRSNYRSHLHHLQDMVALLRDRGLPADRIHVFSADGEDDAPDLAVREALPAGFWLIEGTPEGRRLRPRTEVTNTVWDGIDLRPARKQDLRKWFEEARRTLGPADTLFLFVTDHGRKGRDDPDNGTISLWQEDLSVRDLGELLALLPPGVRVVMLMSQCYSGTFASVIDAGGSGPSGDVCGFFSTSRDLQAYGCYPEGRDRDRIGHAFDFIQALGRHATVAAAHTEVVVTDDTPDVPLRTSDLYLERILEAEADRRGESVARVVDGYLAEAWRDRAAWEPQIRLLDRIGDAFGTFSPRSLAEIATYEDGLKPLLDQMEAYAEGWEAALVSVKAENLRDFQRRHSEWDDRLEAKEVESMEAGARDDLLRDLLAALEPDSRGRTATWSRLEGLAEKEAKASAARWRLEVRRAALMRMRSILTGVAGRVMLQVDPEGRDRRESHKVARAALSGLDACEAFSPGELPAGASAAADPPVDRFPPLADEVKLTAEILPSYLGVRFRPPPKSMKAGQGLPEGAAWLEAIFPDSPADRAGLQAGDIVLGTPDRVFDAAGQLREWTMTSPRGTPLPLRVLRPGSRPEENREIEATLRLEPYPLEWPALPGPPKTGDAAPAIPRDLKVVRGDQMPDLEGRPHLLFFWATWCIPCKRAVPEVLAFAASREMPVLAISDEEPEVLSGFLAKRTEPFFDRVLADPQRRAFITHGVSGTPTIVLVDGEGIVRYRRVGYSSADGLAIDGWAWTP